MRWLRGHAPLVGVFLLALAVRLVYNATVARQYHPAFDGNYYYMLARTLSQAGHYSFTAHGESITNRAPFWPFLMAVIFFVAHPHPGYARLFLSLLGSGTCVLVFAFARDLFGRRVALVTGALAAVYPGLFIYDGWLYSESVYTFLLTAVCYALFRLQRQAGLPALATGNVLLDAVFGWLRARSARRWLVVCGVALGAAALTRPNGIILLGVVYAWALYLVVRRTIRWRTAARWALVVTALAAAIVAPWTLRNYRATHGTVILVASGSGNVLSGAYNDTAVTDPQRPGMWEPMNRIQPPVDFHGHGCCDYTGDGDNTAYALHWIRTHPGDMPLLLTRHLLNMWTPYTSEEGMAFREFPDRFSSHVVWYLIQLMSPVVFLLAGLGLVVTWRRYRRRLVVVYLVLAETTVLNVAYYGSSRFRAPIEPLLVLLAGAAVWWLTSTEPGSLRAWRRGSGSGQATVESRSSTNGTMVPGMTYRSIST